MDAVARALELPAEAIVPVAMPPAGSPTISTPSGHGSRSKLDEAKLVQIDRLRVGVRFVGWFVGAATNFQQLIDYLQQFHQEGGHPFRHRRQILELARAEHRCCPGEIFLSDSPGEVEPIGPLARPRFRRGHLRGPAPSVTPMISSFMSPELFWMAGAVVMLMACLLAAAAE